tara:strand:- start:243 stop:482 length:240 start_codon:yes stop_codon:yes gene_type:complete
MSFGLNKNDLTRDEKDFNARKVFAYTVLYSAKYNYLGFIYINPTNRVDYDCEVYILFKGSEFALDEPLFETVKDWLNRE